MKQALSKQKRPLIVGLLLTLVVSGVTYWADHIEAKNRQSDMAATQTRSLAAGMSAAQGELLASGAFLEESSRALLRFEEFINRLSLSSPKEINWAVVARVQPARLYQFQTWARDRLTLTSEAFVVASADAQTPMNFLMVTAGPSKKSPPGTSIQLPALKIGADSPVLVLETELKIEGQADGLWLVQRAEPPEIQVMNGVTDIYSLRKVDVAQLRKIANLLPEQQLRITWRNAGAPQELNSMGAGAFNLPDAVVSSVNIGKNSVSFAIDRPPSPEVPRTWLLLLMAGLAMTAFWVSWRAAGNLNLRAGALADEMSQTTGRLRVVHEKESVFFENTGTPHCEVDPATGRFLRVNKALCSWLGYSSDELLQKTAYEVSAPEDVVISHLHVERTKNNPDTFIQLEKRYVTKSGHKVWGLVTSNLFDNPLTQDKVFLTTIVDITERKEADAMRDRLVRELAHRVRNTMQLTDSLARQSAVGARSIQGYAQEFRNRLAALSRAQDVLFETNWVSADMRELALRIIMPFDNGKITIDLPSVELPPQHAQTFALAVHELISQSAERGAVKNGKALELKGELGEPDEQGRREMTLTWTEEFRSAGRKTSDKSFGHTLLKVALPRQFDGEAESTQTTHGYKYVARLKLPET